MEDTWMILNTEETNNFFMALRKHDECAGVDGVDPYLPSDDDEFPGTFTIDKYYSKRLMTFVNRSTQKEYEILFPTVDAMKRVLSLEAIIVGHLFHMIVKREHNKNELGAAVEKAVQLCKNREHIKYIGANSSDAFTVELATNFFSFFCGYWVLKNPKC